MQLSRRVLNDLAEIVCGGSGQEGGYSWPTFPYRSSSRLTEFFRQCDLDLVHDGSTRKAWVQEALENLNKLPAQTPGLPATELVRVLQELLDPVELERAGLNREAALSDLNKVITRDGLVVVLVDGGLPQIRNSGSLETSTNTGLPRRKWTKAEVERRAHIADYLTTASEDDFINNVVVPIFSQLGFRRISVAGHKDKSLEYGKDLWMKFTLPTGHILYFGIQAKRNKLDAAGSSKGSNENIAEVVNQVKMMLDNPVWDPDTNRKNLLDHVFIACAGEITKQAKNWLAEHLDKESRRHILFIEREEFLDLALSVTLTLPSSGDDLPWDEQDLPF